VFGVEFGGVVIVVVAFGDSKGRFGSIYSWLWWVVFHISKND
jgi:hypothetical protein